MPPLRRSDRKKSRHSFAVDTSYPDGPPIGSIEELISKLDRQSFPSASFSKMDDILVFSLFASKRRRQNYQALRPSRTFHEADEPVSCEIALDLSKFFTELAKTNTSPEQVAEKFADKVRGAHPGLITSLLEEKALKNLAARYFILHWVPESCIQLQKVQFHVGAASDVACGLKANRDIAAGTVILAACSSMSSDLVIEQDAVSVIEATKDFHHPKGPRLILGPFRFANHDCRPNCQIMAIPNSQAYTLCAILNIQSGDSITVNYSKDGSYFGGNHCGCATCNPSQPPVISRRPYSPSLWVAKVGKKKPRGGRRIQQKKKKKLGALAGIGKMSIEVPPEV